MTIKNFFSLEKHAQSTLKKYTYLFLYFMIIFKINKTTSNAHFTRFFEKKTTREQSIERD